MRQKHRARARRDDRRSCVLDAPATVLCSRRLLCAPMPCPYGKRQQCRFGGFGQSRQHGCLAAESKAKKGPRTFSRADEFVGGLRGMLRSRPDQDGTLTETQVDRVLARAAVPVLPDERLVCGACCTRVRRACLVVAKEVLEEGDEDPPAAAAAAAAASPEPVGKRRRVTRSDCPLLRLLGSEDTGILLHIVSVNLNVKDAAWFGGTCMAILLMANA